MSIKIRREDSFACLIGEDQSSKHEESLDSATSPSVLVVDDNVTNIYALKGLLLKFNVSSEKAVNGRDAISLVENRIIDNLTLGTPMFRLVMLDFCMPEMDGPEVFINIKKVIEQAIKETS